MPPLELGAVVGVRADHQLHALLLDPAERGDVLVRAEQDPRLARARLGGEVGLPFDEAVGVGGEPARQHGRVAVAHRPLQHGLREPVDLEEEDAGDVGDLAVVRPPRDPVHDAERVGVVVVRPDDHLQDRRDGRDDERCEEGPPEVVDLEAALDAADGLEGEGVRDEDEQEGEADGVRQAQRGDQGRHDGVDDRDEERREERAPEVVDPNPGEDCRRGHDRERADDQPQQEVPASFNRGRMSARAGRWP